MACLNTSKPTGVDVATYVYASLAKDEKKMKIPCLDSWCLNKFWVESTPNTLFFVFLSRNARPKSVLLFVLVPPKRDSAFCPKRVTHLLLCASSSYMLNLLSILGSTNAIWVKGPFVLYEVPCHMICVWAYDLYFLSPYHVLYMWPYEY